DRGAAIERPARCGIPIGGLTSRAIGRATTKFAAAPITAHRCDLALANSPRSVLFRSDGIGHSCAARSYGLRPAGGRVANRLMLGCRVELAADQHNDD